MCCNIFWRVDHVLGWGEAPGLDYVFAGHYARVEQDEATGRWLLKKGLDEGKDQSYVLYNLTQQQLAHVRLPLGALHKTEVRAIAEQHHFINARKHDSQDICFVPDGDYARLMEGFTGKHYPAGDFLDENGNDTMEQQIQANYRQIKQDIVELVENELIRIENDPELKHLLGGDEGVQTTS